MYSRSISPSYVRNVQDIDMVGGKTSNPATSGEKFSDVFDGSRRRHAVAERDSTNFSRKHFLNWSSLVQSGRRVVYGLSFPKSHFPKYGTSIEGAGSFFRHSNTLSGDSKLYSVRDILSFRQLGDSHKGDGSQFVSADPSFRTSSLHGLSYVAALDSGIALVSHKDFELDHAAKVVTSSTVGGKHSRSGIRECYSPSEVCASFSDDSESPLFDPDLLSAFEKTLADGEKSIDDANVNSSSDSANVSSSPISLKTKNHGVELKGNLNLREASLRRRNISIGNSEIFLGNCRDKKDFQNARTILEGLLGNSRGRKDSSHSENKTPPAESTNLLDTFVYSCPSDGDQKVVLFLTSLRGIRKTYEDCINVRNLLRSFGVKIDDRDVSLHSDFKFELRELLRGPASLPRLFIKGKYIGGVEEIIRLNEEGVLEKLLEHIPKMTSAFKPCEACGEMRFVLCSQCSGSCKIITYDNNIKRCSDCNENGLVRCLICC